MISFWHIIVPLLLILVNVSVKGSHYSDRKRKIKIIIFVVILTLYAGLRSPDTMVDDYVTAFYWFKTASVERIVASYTGREPVYRLCVRLIALLFDNVQWYFLIHAFLVAGAFGIFTYRHKEDPLIYFLVFLTLRDFSFANCAMRQGIALAVIYAIADKYLCDKKPIRFFISVVIASLFHSSAVYFILAYPLFHYMKKPLKVLIIMLFSSIVLFVNTGLIVTVLEKTSVLEQYEGYVNRGYQVSISTTVFLELIILVVSIVLQRRRKNTIEDSYNKSLSGFENLLSLCCMVGIVGTKAGAMVRLSYYTSQYLSPTIIGLISNGGKVNYKFLYCTFVALLVLQYGIFGPGQMGWYYHFFWVV